MAFLKKTARSAAVTVAGLFIGLSLAGIVGVWFVDHQATEIARKGFGLPVFFFFFFFFFCSGWSIPAWRGWTT